MIGYRADIDGLRALAVLAVVFYHLDLGPVSGGFVGVDVFFVISGYLITSILLRDVVDGGISIARFYERRVRRIFPALIAVLLASFGLALWLLLPLDHVEYSQSLVATTGFASNIGFFREAGYFAPLAERQPLLHTWSLAVEEQFYILFPLLVGALATRGRRLLPVALGVIAAASLALSIALVSRHPAAVFYLLPFRAWELVAGALLAVGAVPAIRSARAAESLSLAGLAMIAWATFGFDRDTTFPGASAILPVLGTAALIHAGAVAGNRLARALAWAPMVFVGKVSYSFYLWHWPIAVFARYTVLRELTTLEAWAVVLASFALAVASWRWIEQPFRRTDGVMSRRALFLAAGAAMALMLALGMAGHIRRGFPGRLPAAVVAYGAGRSDTNPDKRACNDQSLDDLARGKLCEVGPATAAVDFIVWGDSHADALQPLFRAWAEATGRRGLYASRNDCVPLLNVDREEGDVLSCARFAAILMDTVRARGIRNVFLIGRWNQMAQGRPRYELVHGRQREAHWRDAATQSFSLAENRAVLHRALPRTVRALNEAGARVWLVAEVPGAEIDAPRALALRARAGDPVDTLGPTTADHRRRSRLFHELVAALRADCDVALIDPAARLCSDSHCRIAADGRSLYRDGDHLTAFGARWLAPILY